MENKNQLATEKNPYLRQHAHNPIWWQSWGENALAQAKKENKLIFLSIGYSACHWCHVMEKEAFSDQAIAQSLNQNFISIKVDREERPDIDAIYMDAVQAMTGSGGWPLNVFLTPDRVPFFGGTYFPKEHFTGVLRQIAEVWKSNPLKIKESSDQIGKWLSAEKHEVLGVKLTTDIFSVFLKNFEQSFDAEHGGKMGHPKFVPSYELRVLLRIYRRTGNEKVLHFVTKTLDEIAHGGIYDHLGGGFHRYSTDEKWLIPHFEKMLYDQAAFARAYTEAFEVTHNPEYAKVLREILDYVLRDLTSPEGAFYSAEDADSEGAEGKFYVWSDTELKKILTQTQYTELVKAYGVSAHGNFEGALNNLNLQAGFSRAGRTPTLQSTLDVLFKTRSKRVRPFRDEKILTSWNGLMIAVLAEGARVLDEPKYADAAVKAADFILSKGHSSKGLLHRWFEGDAQYGAHAEDYAFFIDGLISVYQMIETSHAGEKYALEAMRLQNEQNKLFQDHSKAAQGTFFDTSGKDLSLIRRSRNFQDSVMPSANSVSLLNLLRLGALFLDEKILHQAHQLILSYPKLVQSRPTYFSQMMMGLDYALDRSREIAIVSDVPFSETKKFVKEVVAGFHPNRVIAVGYSKGSSIPLLKNRTTKSAQSTAYVCYGRVCQLPTEDPKKAHKLASQVDRYVIK